MFWQKMKFIPECFMRGISIINQEVQPYEDLT